MSIRINSDQSEYRGVLDQLTTQAATETGLDTLLPSINKAVTMPLRIREANPSSLVVFIDSNVVTNPLHGRKQTMSPIGSSLPTFAGGFLTLPSMSGGTITPSGLTLTGTTTLTVTSGNFIKMLMVLNSSGQVVLSFGAEGASEAAATLPVIQSLTIPIGYIVIQNLTGTIQNISSSNLYQIGGASAVSGTGDITNGGNSFGSAITLGTNDNYGLNFETNSTTRGSINAAGAWTLGSVSQNNQHKVLSSYTGNDGVFSVVGGGSAGAYLAINENTSAQLYLFGMDTGSTVLKIKAGNSTAPSIAEATNAGAWTFGINSATNEFSHRLNARSVDIPVSAGLQPTYRLSLGATGGTYPSVSYNAVPTSTGLQYSRTGAASETASILTLGATTLAGSAFEFHGFAAGVGGTLTINSSSRLGAVSTAGAWTLGPSGFTGTHTINGSVTANGLISNTLTPVGSIIAYMPGYFTAAANGGSWTTVGPAGNTVAQVNTFLPANWRVCDGTALNDAGSTIFNGAGRYLPDLTGSRFIRGNTTAGSSGGAASVTLTGNELPAHTHGAGSYATSIGLSGSAPSLGGTTSFASTGHTHALGVTGADTLVVQGVTTGGTNLAVQTVTAPFTELKATTAGPSATATVTISGGSYSLTGSNAVANTSGSTGSGNSFSIVPLYLSAFYIMRVK